MTAPPARSPSLFRQNFRLRPAHVSRQRCVALAARQARSVPLARSLPPSSAAGACGRQGARTGRPTREPPAVRGDRGETGTALARPHPPGFRPPRLRPTEGPHRLAHV